MPTSLAPYLDAPLSALMDLTFEARPVPERDLQIDVVAWTQLCAVREIDEADCHVAIVGPKKLWFGR